MKYWKSPWKKSWDKSWKKSATFFAIALLSLPFVAKIQATKVYASAAPDSAVSDTIVDIQAVTDRMIITTEKMADLMKRMENDPSPEAKKAVESMKRTVQRMDQTTNEMAKTTEEMLRANPVVE